MQKRIERQIENIQRAGQRKCSTVNESFGVDAGQIRCSSYRTDETVFIDAAEIRKVKRKAIQMKSSVLTHFAGIFYQQCMEELGIWEVEKYE